MQRRDFLRAAALSISPALVPGISRLAWGASEEQRHGDLLIRPRATDHFELVFTPSRARPMRVLQLTDTHFHPGDDTNRATEATLRKIVERERPDFIVHTGDFVNNDSAERVEWTGLDILNGLQVPWTLCFGNHDYPVHKAEGSRPLEEIRGQMERGYQGFVEGPDGRYYCYRYDLLNREDRQPSASLFFFQVGYAEGDRRISAPQLAWFERQMEIDAERGTSAPITVFVHIPLLEYHHLYESGRAEGEKGERVCYDSDTGESFRLFSESGRVAGVFCGHDHVNNYHGDWQGIELVYGRVSGWGGYGPKNWSRGGRLISFDLAAPRALPRHVEVV